MLGIEGIGKYHAKFQVAAITNTKGEPLLQNDTIYMEKCEVMTLLDYVEYRLKNIFRSGLEGKLVFKTPLTLKYRGEFLKEFRIDAILEAALRRIYMLDCYEGIDEDVTRYEIPEIPDIVSQSVRNVQVRRFSSKQQSGMILHGIEGQMALETIDEEVLPVLLAGELVHVGKNSRFGFGRYQVK